MTEEGRDTPGIGVMRWRRGVPLRGERRAGERTEEDTNNRFGLFAFLMFGFIHASSELCTRATSEDLVSFQLKGHDHAVKASQLRGGDQHPGEGSKVRFSLIRKNHCFLT